MLSSCPCLCGLARTHAKKERSAAGRAACCGEAGLGAPAHSERAVPAAAHRPLSAPRAPVAPLAYRWRPWQCALRPPPPRRQLIQGQDFSIVRRLHAAVSYIVKSVRPSSRQQPAQAITMRVRAMQSQNRDRCSMGNQMSSYCSLAWCATQGCMHPCRLQCITMVF